MVDAEGTEEDTSVMTTQVAIERPDALGTKVEEDRVDELYDVIAAEAGECRFRLMSRG